MSWEDNVRKVVPYVAGEQPGGDVIKLNTNEFPYPPSTKVLDRLAQMANPDSWGEWTNLRKYPDLDATHLVNAISCTYNIPFDNIFVGVGSDDVLAISFMTFFAGKKPVLFPDITYSFYDVWADLFGIPYKTCALNENFEINVGDYFAPNGGIVIPNPNAPTGISKPVSFFEEIIKANPGSVVIIDEAYVDFGAESCLPLISKYDNVLVVQTFSKSRALAGLRIGVAFGNKRLIEYMQDVKFSFNSYTMNYPAIELGAAAVLDKVYYKEAVNKVIETREWTKEELEKLGFEFSDSKANFIFATHKKIPATHIYEELKKRKIYVRHFNKPRIANYLRISIGTEDEMKTLMKNLKEIIA